MNRKSNETMSTQETNTVSIIVPCYNEAKYIKSFLDNLKSQNSANNIGEIIIADGMSDDGTRTILFEQSKESKLIRVVDNKSRFVSHGLNLAIKEAKGEIIIRMDMHTIYAKNYIEMCIKTLKYTGAQNVGGPARTTATSYIQRANGLAYSSKFSVGGARFHFDDYEGFVDTVTYGCWWKATLLNIGLFDEKLIRNQDDELNYRIIKSGGKIWQSPQIKSWYFPRDTLRGIFKQYMQYGYWKVEILKKHKMPSSWRQLMPATFLLTLFAFGITATMFNISYIIFWAIITSYLTANFIFSILSCNAKNTHKYILVMPFIFMMYHFGYGIGYIFGLLRVLVPNIILPRALTESSR